MDEGAVALGGRVPVNPSGGLLSRGHPVGATGVAQIVEVVTQLRSEAGPRQVEGARVGLAQCMGGVTRTGTPNRARSQFFPYEQGVIVTKLHHVAVFVSGHGS